MDASEKWMIFQFTPQQTTPLPTWMFFPKTFLKIILAAKWLGRHLCKYVPQMQQRRPLPSFLSNSSNPA